MLRRTRTPSVFRVGSVARVHGVDLHWVELGEGPPVVLLHGLGDSHRTWSHVAPSLARSCRVLVPDLLGHGLSGRPDASYSLEWHARIIGAWLDELGLASVDIVGHSYGGGIAQWMLIDQAHRVRKLALVAAGGLGREVALALRLAAIPFVVERMGQPFMTPGTFLALNAIRGVYPAGEVARLSWMNGTRGSARAFARSVRDVIDLGGQRRGFFQHAHQIPALPPIGLFWGEKDRVVPVSHALEAAPRIDGATVIRFPKCGHYPHREQPHRFVMELEAFLGHGERKAVVMATR
jgi:pimeloyl-ACP methyl ester carboxylesterase